MPETWRIGNRASHHRRDGHRHVIGRLWDHKRALRPDRLPLVREMVVSLHGMVSPRIFFSLSPIADGAASRHGPGMLPLLKSGDRDNPGSYQVDFYITLIYGNLWM